MAPALAVCCGRVAAPLLAAGAAAEAVAAAGAAGAGAEGGAAGGAPSPSLGFPGCPAQDCAITVGLTLARVIVASPQLAGARATWNATLDIATGTATVDLGSGDGSG